MSPKMQLLLHQLSFLPLRWKCHSNVVLSQIGSTVLHKRSATQLDNHLSLMDHVDAANKAASSTKYPEAFRRPKNPPQNCDISDCIPTNFVGIMTWFLNSAISFLIHCPKQIHVHGQISVPRERDCAQLNFMSSSKIPNCYRARHNHDSQ